MELVIRNEQEMENLGELLSGYLESKDTIYLIGTLGAGKTTLVRGIARGFGYKGRVTSPTFTLMNIYETLTPIYHFDFYRLEDNDVGDLGLEDYLEKEGVTIIEWPQAGQAELPEEALFINIDLTDEDYDRERRVIIKAIGEKYEQKLEELKKIVDSGRR